MSRFSIFFLAAVGIGLSFGFPIQGQNVNKKVDPQDLISFAWSFSAEDPFHDANQRGKKTQFRRGEIVRLQITGTPKKGFHTYPVTMRTAIQETTGLTQLKYGPIKGLMPLWPIQESAPQSVQEGNLGTFLEHEGPFTLTQDFLILPDAQPGPVVIPIQVRSQVCENICTWVDTEIKAELEISKEEPLSVSSQLSARGNEKKPEIIVVGGNVPDNPSVDLQPNRSVTRESAGGLITGSQEEYRAGMEAILANLVHKDAKMPVDLMAFILAGVFWGGISLITPCVFPMIPITVSFFLKQSEKENHRPIAMALVYSATIVIVLTLAAAFLLSAFRWLSINPIMNYFLGALFIFFALSLFGMYEIELPSGLARFTSSKEGKGGMVGTIFMALTFTIISFACVAPFLGGFGGTAGTMPRPWWHNILGGLAFSLTFASPFFLLALFPTLLKKMPKSGSWLNSVKVVMGFLELAAAFKFFRAAELVQSATPTLFTFDLILGIWIALLLLCGLYLLGMYRLPHDTPAEHIGVPSLLFAVLFLGLAIYLFPAMFKINSEGEPQRPMGAIYAWVDSFLLPDVRPGKESNTTGNLQYALSQAQEARRRTGQPQRIFLDFTGISCTNCNKNEHNVFSKPEIQRLFQNYRVVQIYTDKVPNYFYAPELRAKFGTDTTRQTEDGQFNEAFQKKGFGSIQLPLYVILEPQPDGMISVVGTYDEGLILNQSAFAEFLRDPK